MAGAGAVPFSGPNQPPGQMVMAGEPWQNQQVAWDQQSQVKTMVRSAPRIGLSKTSFGIELI